MSALPLFNEEPLPKRKVGIREVEIPFGYWNSSYSNSFYKTSKFTIYKIGKCKKNELPSTAGWDLAKGDYKVQSTNVNTHDYVYYRNLKIKFLKYSIYPVIVITMLLVLKFSEILSKV